MQRAARSELFRRISAMYGRDGVAPLCLRLQDEFGLDVSLGLSALVDGAGGRCWSSAMLAELRQGGWDDRTAVTRALRRARELAKPLAASDPAVAELRTTILRQELESERLAVVWLEARLAALPAGAASDGAALANLHLVAGAEVPHHLLERLVEVCGH
ncbi:MAG TPA: DUF2390 domain-containing protein [Geminicoccus sp.]|jgi:uncharacterized protein (TIGR02444 family)|uniref:DUF2390 domain-containing protein n=1 Tax=Geminicoccus sp. TaxID=2024832 RepID=UPI002E329EF1|nr:DUF2390 domain-containing protein [Geminicoccus sp.]HEX2528049.1 DUF2390 domain-containing protein [Geminicoccus sp.]